MPDKSDVSIRQAVCSMGWSCIGWPTKWDKCPSSSSSRVNRRPSSWTRWCLGRGVDGGGWRTFRCLLHHTAVDQSQMRSRHLQRRVLGLSRSTSPCSTQCWRHWLMTSEHRAKFCPRCSSVEWLDAVERNWLVLPLWWPDCSRPGGQVGEDFPRCPLFRCDAACAQVHL